MNKQKSWLERGFHAVMYELCAMALLVPLASLVMEQSLLHMGALAFMMSTAAMMWNVVFNMLFDRMEAAMGWSRTVGVRTLHALMFEGGLVIMLVPLAALVAERQLLAGLPAGFGLLRLFPALHLYIQLAVRLATRQTAHARRQAVR
ncbi:PACE efflux transporter [Chromobacterium haemolyticum]|nr:PACE efflux transporter [Chromobacterium haemolyticum]